MAHCCTLGNLEATQRSQDHRQEEHPPKAHELPGRAWTQGPQGPTQLSPEGLSHRPPLGLITLTLLVNSLHNQVHDVEQDPGNKNQLLTEQDGGSRKHPWLLHIPANVRKAEHKGWLCGTAAMERELSPMEHLLVLPSLPYVAKVILFCISSV